MSYTYKDFIADLRHGKYNSVGCYPRYFVTSEGGAVSYEAAKAEVLHYARETRAQSGSGWHIIGCEINWENSELYCQDTDERIPSAYAEPESEAMANINEAADISILCRRLFGSCREVDGKIIFAQLGKSVSRAEVADVIEETRRLCDEWSIEKTITFVKGRIRARMRQM